MAVQHTGRACLPNVQSLHHHVTVPAAGDHIWRSVSVQRCFQPRLQLAPSGHLALRARSGPRASNWQVLRPLQAARVKPRPSCFLVILFPSRGKLGCIRVHVSFIPPFQILGVLHDMFRCGFSSFGQHPASKGRLPPQHARCHCGAHHEGCKT